MILLGNLGADPEMRAAGSTPVLKLRLATSRKWKDKDGVVQEATEWHSCNVWGNRATGLAKILHKGDRVYLEGSLRTSSYEKDGQKRYTTDINVDEVVLCGGGKRDGKPAESAPAGDGGDSDDPLPF